MIMHLVLALIQYDRNHFGYKKSFLNDLFLGLQSMALIYTIAIIVQAIKYLQQHLILEGPKTLEGYRQMGIVPQCMNSPAELKNIRGHSLEWFLLEIAIFVTYQITMLFLMVKHRIIAMMNSDDKQFNSVYMSLMCNEICRSVPLELSESLAFQERQRARWVRKVRKITVDSSYLFVCFTDQDFQRLWETKLLNDPQAKFVEPNDANRFLNENVVGNITPIILNQQRAGEFNSMDIMTWHRVAEHVDLIYEF